MWDIAIMLGAVAFIESRHTGVKGGAVSAWKVKNTVAEVFVRRSLLVCEKQPLY